MLKSGAVIEYRTRFHYYPFKKRQISLDFPLFINNNE